MDHDSQMTEEAMQKLETMFNGPKHMLHKDVSLGLTISKLICQSFGGEIKVKPHKLGTEISISFRLSDKSEAHSSCTMVLNDKCQSINAFFK